MRTTELALPVLGAMILHLNDDHQWTREEIAAWVEFRPDAAPPAPPA